MASRLDFAPVRDLNAGWRNEDGQWVDIKFEENKARLILAMQQVNKNRNLRQIKDIAGKPPDAFIDYVRGLCPVRLR